MRILLLAASLAAAAPRPVAAQTVVSLTPRNEAIVELPVIAQASPPTGAQEPPPAGTYSTSPVFRTFRAPASPEDRAAIRDLMRRYGQARSSQDARAVAATFAEDAELTNGFGEVIRGSDNIERFMAWVFASDGAPIQRQAAAPTQGLGDSYRPLSIRYLSDDAAIVHGMTQSTGREVKPRSHQTWVLAKENGQWRIVHQHNSNVPD